jgi:tetratricopeptide (TPR) repeat protein
MNEEQALSSHAEGQQLQSEGKHELALDRFAQAAAYFESADGPESPDLANVLADQAQACLFLCRFRDAERLARKMKEIVDTIRPRLDCESRAALGLRSHDLWGRTLRELGRYPEAAIQFEAAIQEAEAIFGMESAEIAPYLNSYGVLCKYWGKFEPGEQAYLRALGLLEREHGQQHMETATVYHNLGGLEHARGNFEKGEPLARLAYEIRRQAWGDQDPLTMMDAVAWGGLLDGLGRYEQSMPIYRRALTFYEARFGPDHFEVAATLNNLGMAQAAQGDLAGARESLSRCLAIKAKLFPEAHPEYRLTHANLARISEYSMA